VALNLRSRAVARVSAREHREDNRPCSIGGPFLVGRAPALFEE
jgi:hypothetical protein